MNIITRELSQDVDRIEIHPLADLHLGDKCCDYKAIQKELAYIRDTPNCYCLLDGDLMDAAIKSSVGDTYGAGLQPMEQLKHCVAIFAPIADKIIAVCGGNHEDRIYKNDGLDMTELMCAQLGIAERYSPTTALIYLRLGRDIKHSGCRYFYSIYMTHGTGGGRKEGGKVQRLADLAGITDADIYLMAHTHQPAVLRNAFYRPLATLGKVAKVEHLFVNTASWLEYGGYGDKQGYKPASNINPVIWLDGRRKHAYAVI